MPLSEELRDAIAHATATAMAAMQEEREKREDKEEVKPKVDAVAIKVADFWESDAKGFFVKLEHQFALKPVTEDKTKYSYLIQCLTPAVRDRLGSYLDEPGQPGVDYKNLKEELIKIYSKADVVRCKEVMAIRSMGDKSPEGLLRYMKKLLPDKKEQESLFFKTIWLEALPEAIRDSLLKDDDAIEQLAASAEKIWSRKKAFSSPQVFAVQEEQHPQEVAAVVRQAQGQTQKQRSRFVCANHVRYGPNTFSCLDPKSCLLRDAIVQRPSQSRASGANALPRSGNAGAGR